MNDHRALLVVVISRTVTALAFTPSYTAAFLDISYRIGMAPLSSFSGNRHVVSSIDSMRIYASFPLRVETPGEPGNLPGSITFREKVLLTTEHAIAAKTGRRVGSWTFPQQAAPGPGVSLGRGVGAAVKRTETDFRRGFLLWIYENQIILLTSANARA